MTLFYLIAIQMKMRQGLNSYMVLNGEGKLIEKGFGLDNKSI